tara:strand:+ start:2446 stop:9612 length:7167 start_codon:yes stop_codon:yes gene_type:complete
VAEKETEEQPPVETPTEVEPEAEAKAETKVDPKKAFELSEEEEAKRKKLNKDLKLERLSLLIATQRDAERDYDPEAFQAKKEKNEPTFDYDAVLQSASEFTGLTPDEYKAAAQQQEAPLSDLFKEIGEEEKPVTEVMEKYKKRDTDFTAGIESRPWTLTERQRNIKLRGRKIVGKGITRVGFGEKKLPEEERKKTLKTLLKGFDPEDRARIYWTGDNRGEAEDAVVKQGQAGYARLEQQADRLINPEIADDKEKAEKLKSFFLDLGPDAGANIRETLAESKFKDLIDLIARHDVAKMAEREGIKWGYKGYDAIKKKALKNAVYEATLFRTVNKFYPPGFISYDLIDPKGRQLSRDNADDDTWFEKAWDNASEVRLEVIGLDPKGVPVYRLTHPTWHMFELMDTPQSALTGAMERLAGRREGEGIGTAIYEGSLEGIKDRRDFLKAALSSEAAEDGTLGALALGSAGLIAAILTPDLLMGAAGVARTTKRVTDAAASVANFRRAAPELVTQLGDGAVNLARTEDLLQEVQLAVSRGSYDEAISLIDEAQEAAKSSDLAISKARTVDKKIAQVVDQTDSDIARRIGQRVPEITFTEGKRLAADVPGSFGETAHNIHPSTRRKVLRGKSLDQTVGFGELLSSRQTLDDLKESVELLKGGDVDKAFTARLRELAARPFSDNTSQLMEQFGVAMGSEQLSDSARQLSVNLMAFLERPAGTRLLRDNPTEWRKQITQLAEQLKFAGPDEAEGFTKGLNKLLDRALIDAKKATKATRRVSMDMARMATAKAIGAVRANFESRAAAMAFVREKVAAQASIDAEPLLVQLTDRYAAIGREGLSPEALQFQDAIIRLFPELEGDDSLKIVKLADQEARKFAAEDKSRTIADFYKERFAGLVGRVDEGADIAADATPVVKSSPDAPDVIEISSPTLEQAARGGGMSLRPDTAFGSSVLRVDSVEIPVVMRGQGLGVDLYIRALKQAQAQGAGFISDVAPNADATRVYRSLENLGVKFTRKPAKDAGGNLVDAFFIDSKDLAKIDLDAAARQNRRRPMGGDLASNPLAVEFLENGQAIIKAVGTSATVDDFVRAIGKVSRRDLDAKGMAAVVAWLGAKGINVSHRGAVFTGDAAAIEAAETEFASAFADYVKSGRADKPELVGPFSSVRERITDIYAGLRGAEIEGATLDIDEGLRASLDKLLRVPAKRVGMPNVLGIVKDALISPNLKGTQVDVLEEMVRESYRLGTPISKKALKAQYVKALEAHNAGRTEDAIVRLPGPISIRGWTSSNVKAGKSEFTLGDLADIQFDLETAKRLEIQDAAKLPLGGDQAAIKELSPSELVDQLATSNPIKRAARFMYLGGDAYDDMRGLPPIVRDAVMAGARRVQQSIGEAIALVKEGDITNLTRLLTGEQDVTFSKSGRSAVSAGHDSVASVTRMLNTYFKSVDADDLSLIQKFALRVRIKKSGAAAIEEFSDEDKERITKSIHAIIKGSRFVEEVFQAAGYTGSRLEPKFMFEPAEGLDAGGLLETLMYYSNMVGRADPQDGGNINLLSTTQSLLGVKSTSQNTFTGLYEDIVGKFADPMVANRISILIAGHGMADAAKLHWVKLGIAADEALHTAMSNYIVGESLNPEEIVRVKRAFESLGYNPATVEGYSLDGINIYVPRAARNRLNMALSQAQDPALLKVDEMDTMAALNAIWAAPEEIMSGGGTNKKVALSFALFYRYLKTRMVRGHFVLKSRYFWMNTFDHFNQVALVTGYRTALASTIRMSTQNVLSNPLGQAAVFAARQADRGEATEAFRKVLQNGGDKAAQWAGKLTRASKWDINVNGILEGSDEIILIAGKPYRKSQIRQIALEAGIFASFDTSQLGTKIQNVGNLFLTQQSKKGRLSQMGLDILEDMKGASEDIAEAWAERERLGCMITLMEQGIDPTTAAKISIEALYDYAGSMSKADRNFLLNIFFPFWAFQKNANRQVFNTIFSPEGAYRLGVMRRAYDKGSEYLSYLTYNAGVDENGVTINALPPELRQTYFAFKNQLQEIYDGNENIPPGMNEQIRMFIAHASVGYADGQMLAADPEIQGKLFEIAKSLKGEGGEGLVLDRRALASYYTPRPQKAGLQTYLRDRIGVAVPYFPEDYPETTANFEPPEDFQRNTKLWNDLYRQTNPSAPYLALFMPETTYAAGFNHFSYLMSMKILTLQKLEDMGDTWFTDEDDGSDAISPLTPLNALLNYERAPVKSDIEASLGMGGSPIPKKIAPLLVHFFEYQMIDLLELDQKDDVFDLQIKQEIAVEEGREAKALPRKRPGTEVMTGKKYYMMPGVAQLLFTNSPLGELNDILLRAEKLPAERAAGLRGDITKWARLISGLDQREIARHRTAASEKYRAEETSAVTGKKVRANEPIK